MKISQQVLGGLLFFDSHCIVSALNVQTQGTAARLTIHKRFQRSFELSEGDVRLPKLLREVAPKPSPGCPERPPGLRPWTEWNERRCCRTVPGDVLGLERRRKRSCGSTRRDQNWNGTWPRFTANVLVTAVD